MRRGRKFLLSSINERRLFSSQLSIAMLPTQLSLPFVLLFDRPVKVKKGQTILYHIPNPRKRKQNKVISLLFFRSHFDRGCVFFCPLRILSGIILVGDYDRSRLLGLGIIAVAYFLKKCSLFVVMVFFSSRKAENMVHPSPP